ncbi:MAG: hypothetical protein COC00_002895 [Rhizobiales bacterium]|nr:hypothetical protein [Hyphomicrobiales bacterium]
MTKKLTSGLEKVPKILKSPFYKDRLFWIGLATLAFWIALFYGLFS